MLPQPRRTRISPPPATTRGKDVFLMAFGGCTACQHRDKGKRGGPHRGEGHVNTEPQSGKPAATGCWKRQGTDPPAGAPGGAQPCQHLDFGLVVTTTVGRPFCYFKLPGLRWFVTVTTGN